MTRSRSEAAQNRKVNYIYIRRLPGKKPPAVTKSGDLQTQQVSSIAVPYVGLQPTVCCASPLSWLSTVTSKELYIANKPGRPWYRVQHCTAEWPNAGSNKFRWEVPLVVTGTVAQSFNSNMGRSSSISASSWQLLCESIWFISLGWFHHVHFTSVISRHFTARTYHALISHHVHFTLVHFTSSISAEIHRKVTK